MFDSVNNFVVRAGAEVAQNPKTTYSLSGAGGVFSLLTLNEIAAVFGVIVSVILATFTAWSNHKRNKAQIRAASAQEKMAHANLQPYPTDEEN